MICFILYLVFAGLGSDTISRLGRWTRMGGWGDISTFTSRPVVPRVRLLQWGRGFG